MFKFLIILLSFCLYAHAAEIPTAKSINDKNLKWGPCPDIFPKGCEISVLNGDPKMNGADVFLRVPGNYSIPPHSHTSAERMILVAGNLEVKYKDQELLVLKPGSYAFGPAKHPHKARCTSKEACVLFIGFNEPVDANAYTGNL